MSDDTITWQRHEELCAKHITDILLARIEKLAARNDWLQEQRIVLRCENGKLKKELEALTTRATTAEAAVSQAKTDAIILKMNTNIAHQTAVSNAFHAGERAAAEDAAKAAAAEAAAPPPKKLGRPKKQATATLTNVIVKTEQ